MALQTLSEAYEYDFTKYYSKCTENLKQSKEAVNYLSNRGIRLETAINYGVGFDNFSDPANAPGGVGELRHPRARIILPTCKSHYVARAIDGIKEFAKVNPKGARADIFNLKSLQNGNGVVFVVEGFFDALSLIEIGHDAIALNSTSNALRLSERLRSDGTKRGIVICLDNDKAGREATGTLSEALTDLNIDFFCSDICGGFKDPNEALVADRKKFRLAVEDVTRRSVAEFSRLRHPDSTTDYINTIMSDEIEELKKYRHLKTGFSNIDAIIGNLYPDLYIIGAISSLGKTTFCVQMADQIASMGNDVLFFSLEQSRLEIISKCISRRTAQSDVSTAVTSLSVRRGYLPYQVLKVAQELAQDVQERLSVIEGDFENNVNFIRDYVHRYIAKNNTRPVVFVDYLQILQPSDEKKQTTKEAVDEIVKTLKQISKKEKITVFAVSSLNRSNYLSPVDFESFKESGLIEYTAGVVWGLQLQVMNSDLFSAKEKTVAKRKAVKTEKKRNPRLIELVCLKNRYGEANFSVYFEYYPQFDLFEVSDGMFYDSNGELTDTKLPDDSEDFFSLPV
ncbi:MAG: toprim domain-containing protein [Ruminococcus sp.]|nr:toprim domain-containing protein [Ruminococcus sp.]